MRTGPNTFVPTKQNNKQNIYIIYLFLPRAHILLLVIVDIIVSLRNLGNDLDIMLCLVLYVYQKMFSAQVPSKQLVSQQMDVRNTNGH